VIFDVVLCRVFRVFAGVDVMTVSEMSVMRSGFVIFFGMMPGGFPVMTRSVLVMLRCLSVMLRCFM
jgi:hypothetical protein